MDNLKRKNWSEIYEDREDEKREKKLRLVLEELKDKLEKELSKNRELTSASKITNIINEILLMYKTFDRESIEYDKKNLDFIKQLKYKYLDNGNEQDYIYEEDTEKEEEEER